MKDAAQKAVCRFTLDREAAPAHADLHLLGLDHLLVQEAPKWWQAPSPESIGVAASFSEGPRVLTWRLVETRGPSGEHRATVLPLGMSDDGKRNARLERLVMGVITRAGHVNTRRLQHARRSSTRRSSRLSSASCGSARSPEGGSYAAKLIDLVE